jgi:hypothetical protein
MAIIDTGTIVAVENSTAANAQPIFVTRTGPLLAREGSSAAGILVPPVLDVGTIRASESSSGYQATPFILPPPAPLQPFPIISDLVQVRTFADPIVAANKYVSIISYRNSWSRVQPQAPAGGAPTSDPNDPSWDWSFWDQCFAQAESFNKGVWMRLLCQQGSCPSWCRSQMQQYFDTTGQNWCLWWDPVYVAYTTALYQAVAARYGARKSFKVFSANMHAGGTGDWSMPQVAASTNAKGAGNWTLASAWACPVSGGTVTVFPAPNQTVYKNWVVQVPNFGWFFVTNVTGPNTNPTAVTLQNLGYAGNANSGTVAASAIMQVSDIQQLTSPYYNYTTGKVINAMGQVFTAAMAAFPVGVVISQEVGRSGTVDPQPQQGMSWSFNAATQLAQWGYANLPRGRWRISLDHLNGSSPLPHLTWAKEDGSNHYLSAQPVYGSLNTSGTFGSIPQGAETNMQWNCGVWDETGQYTPQSTSSAQGGVYAANGGTPYHEPAIVFQSGMKIAQYYGLKIVECYELDIRYGLLDAIVAQDPLLMPPYAGQGQTEQIAMAYPPPGWECGPFVVPPYPAPEPPTTDPCVPPPVYMTDIFSAQQTWPL